MADRESTAADLRESLRRIRDERRATLELLAGIDNERARRTPSSGGWSAGQVLDHLIKTDGVYRTWIGRLLDRKAAGRTPVIEVSLRELNTRPFFVPAAALPQLDAPFRLMNRFVPQSVREALTGTAVIPVEAPSEAVPGPARPIEDLRREGADSTGQLETMLAGQDVFGMVLDHPLLGRHTIPSLLGMLVRHENRHQTQISRILADDAMTAKAPALSPSASTARAESTVDPADRLKSFADDAETALKAGRQMVEWWREKTLRDELKFFSLKEPPRFEMNGFFDSLLFIGQMKPTSIMGCLQTHRFSRRRAPARDAGAHLESFIDGHFLARSYQARADGTPGGFRYRPLCLKEKSGRLVEPDGDLLGLDLASLRKGCEWGVLRVDILDFVRANPALAPYDKTLSRFIKQSAYIVIHEDLALEPTNGPPKGVIAERRFGYAFLPRSVEPNFFGFGPGKFGAAIKQWRFLMYVNGDVEVRVAFLVAPRSERVMDFGGFDPVYGGVEMANAFSLGALGLKERAHKALDHVFLEHHGDVHARIVEGMADVWEGQRWAPSFGSW